MYQTLISVKDAKNILGDVVFVDCRHQLGTPSFGAEQYRLGHLPRAHFAHIDQDLSSAIIPGRTGRHPLPEQESLISLFSGFGIGKETQVVVYDQDIGMFASRLWWLLRAMGHLQVAVLDGGYSAWIACGGEIDYTIPERVEAKFEGVWQPHSVESQAVFVQLGVSDRVLIDARLPERFKGIEESIDRKAGHIPGAINMPFTLNCQNGYWRSKEELRARFEKFSASEMVSYCGSGVTACHNILACVHADLPEPLLYAGSWSEWITDDSRPIETVSFT